MHCTVKGMYEERIIELHVMVADYHLFVYYFIYMTRGGPAGLWLTQKRKLNNIHHLVDHPIVHTHHQGSIGSLLYTLITVHHRLIIPRKDKGGGVARRLL